MRCLRYAVVGLSVFISGFVHTSETCEGASTQMKLNQCSANAYQAADDELNDTYQALMERLNSNEESTQKLRTAQRAWISFRDAECAFVSSAVEGGSAQPMVRNGCLTELTQARTVTLKAHGQCEEGDLSCVR